MQQSKSSLQLEKFPKKVLLRGYHGERLPYIWPCFTLSSNTYAMGHVRDKLQRVSWERWLIISETWRKLGRKSEICLFFFPLKYPPWKCLIQIGRQSSSKQQARENSNFFQIAVCRVRGETKQTCPSTGFCCLVTLMGDLLWYLRTYSPCNYDPAVKAMICSSD